MVFSDRGTPGEADRRGGGERSVTQNTFSSALGEDLFCVTGDSVTQIRSADPLAASRCCVTIYPPMAGYGRDCFRSNALTTEGGRGYGEKQHYMTEAERYKLEAFLRAGKGVSWIARELGFCRQTIYNELRRGAYVHTCEWWDEVRYSADKGQQVHKYNQTAKGRPIKLGKDFAYAKFLEEKMLGVQENGKIERKKRCSPAVALELARREGFQTKICVSTLYGYIENGVFLHITNKDLWEKSKRKKRGYEPVRRMAHPKLPA